MGNIEPERSDDGWVSRWKSLGPSKSPTGICLIMASLAALAGGMYYKDIAGKDFIGIYDYLVPGGMLALSATALPISRGRYLLAVALFPPLTAFCLALGIGFAFLGFSMNLLPGFVACAAVCGFAGYLALKWDVDLALLGGVACGLGVVLLMAFGWLMRVLFPPQLTYVEPPMFVTLLLFGPIIGLSLVLPARIYLKS